MSTSDLPILDFDAPGTVHPLPRGAGRVVPIRFDDAVRRAEHRQRLLRRVQEMHDAAAIAAKAERDQADAAIFERGRQLGRVQGHQLGYVEGTHRGLWLGFFVGAIAAVLTGYLAVQLRVHWPAWHQHLPAITRTAGPIA